MWDIGGQESLRSSWNTYFADSDFVIFVVDSTDRERLPISKMEERFLYKLWLKSVNPELAIDELFPNFLIKTNIKTYEVAKNVNT